MRTVHALVSGVRPVTQMASLPVGARCTRPQWLGPSTWPLSRNAVQGRSAAPSTLKGSRSAVRSAPAGETLASASAPVVVEVGPAAVVPVAAVVAVASPAVAAAPVVAAASAAGAVVAVAAARVGFERLVKSRTAA